MEGIGGDRRLDARSRVLGWRTTCSNRAVDSSRPTNQEETAMLVSEMMTREVQTCNAGDSLNTAAEMMWRMDCGCLPVVDDDGKDHRS